MSLQLKGNKGEWSEVYVLLKLIVDGALNAKVGSGGSSYKIVSVIREEKTGTKSYKLEAKDALIGLDGADVRRVCRAKIAKVTEHLLSEIKKLTNKSQLQDDDVDQLLDLLECRQLKAKSSKKTDINVVVHDHTTSMPSELGFSVKSKVGSDSTIFNPGNTTKFVFRINGDLSNDQLKQLESLHHLNKAGDKAYETRKIVRELLDIGATMKFERVVHPVFEANLIKIDSMLPEILSLFLMEWFAGGEKEIHKICDKLDEENPMSFPCDTVPDIYHYKLKKFLAEVALGMTPSKPWTGLYDATGGFIIIEEDGEIVCFHLIDRNLLEDYLFENTYLDTPSSAKYGSYGGVYKEKGEYKIELCLQVRFHDRLKL